MKKNLWLLILCLWAGIPLMAQNFTHEFGKYTGEEFQMSQYDKDPSAEAVVIYDIGTSYFQQTTEGYTLMFERKTKIKIFNKAGQKYAQFRIPYYMKERDNERIVELEGNTYNFENGSVRTSTLNEKNTFTEKESENWMVKKFAMPDVKDGSIVEIRYKISSPYFFNFRSWDFQGKIPEIYSEYVTKMIPFYEYTYILQGINKLDSYKNYQEVGNTQEFRTITYNNMIYEFVMKDVPAFKDESFITSLNDYIIKLDFQLSAVHSPWGGDQKIMTTWPNLIDDLLKEESFGKYLKSAQKKAKEITDTMKLAKNANLENVMHLDKFLKSYFSWNGHQSKFTIQGIKDLFKTKVGNSAEINLFYIAMLSSLGIESYPVIISTRDHGKINRNYPFQHFFNYVVAEAKIDDKFILLDATEPMNKFNEIPTYCLNDKGLVIKKEDEKYELIDIRASVGSTITYNIELQPESKSDSTLINLHAISTGYDAANFRKRYHANPRELKEELLLKNQSLRDSIKVVNLNDLDKPFEAEAKYASPNERVDDKILISPFCDLIMTENPLKQTFRNYPVDMVYRKEKKYVSILHVPDGYKVATLPSNLNTNNDDVRIQYITEVVDNKTIRVTGTTEYKKSIYGASSYIDLKGYFNKIIDKFNEKIVLVKQ